MESLGSPVWIGQYRLTSRIATGGMAEIYVGRHISEDGTFGPIVAVKKLLPHLVKDSSIVRMFLNEARITAQIHHSNVVRIFELGQVDGEPYIAMELLEGRTFADLRARAAEEGKRLPLGVALRVLTDACHGLDAAHRATGDDGQPLALVHRDFTPDNIHVGVGGEVKVIDFGIAKTASWGAGTEPGTLKGKFFYMSPEMILAKPVDHRADIFAAGVMLYEQLCGRRPFTGISVDEVVMKIADGKMAKPTSFDPSVPRALENACLTALKRNPEERFRSLAAFADAMEDTGLLSTPEQVGSCVGDLFPERTDARRITLRRAREADPSTPNAKGPDALRLDVNQLLGPSGLPATVSTPLRHGRPAERTPLPAFLGEGPPSAVGPTPFAVFEPADVTGPMPVPVPRPAEERITERTPTPRSRLSLVVTVLTLVALAGGAYFAIGRPSQSAMELLGIGETTKEPAPRTKALLSLAKAPDATDAQLAMGGTILLEAKQWDVALQYCDSWLARAPKSVDARVTEARAALGARKSKRAEAALKEAMALAPDDPRPDAVMAELRELQGESGGALEAWTRAAKKNPTDVHARSRQGWWLSQSGKLDEAEEVLEATIKKRFEPEAAAELGFVKFRKERPAEAMRLLQRVVKEQPSLMTGHYYLAAVLYQKGDVKTARAEYLEADALAGADNRPLVSLCEMEAQQKTPELEDAKKRLRERFPQEAASLISRCAVAPEPKE